MADEVYTFRELMLVARQTPSVGVTLRYMYMPDLTYGDFANLVEDAIDIIADDWSANPKYKQGRTEDELSVELVQNLSRMGLAATHDAMTGGHCDIVVVGRGFSWLGEAKIHRGYDWLLKGYHQLTTRYSSGLATNSRGGIVIYSEAPRIDLMMKRWEDHLRAKETNLVTSPCTKRHAAFTSEQSHQSTGAQYCVRHIAVCLHFDPKA